MDIQLPPIFSVERFKGRFVILLNGIPQNQVLIAVIVFQCRSVYILQRRQFFLKSQTGNRRFNNLIMWRRGLLYNYRVIFGGHLKISVRYIPPHSKMGLFPPARLNIPRQIMDSYSASSRKPRRRRGLGIGAEILFCLKKDWSGKPAPSGKPPNNEYALIPNPSEIGQLFLGSPSWARVGGGSWGRGGGGGWPGNGGGLDGRRTG